MKKIKLTQDKYAIVDDWNYEWLNQWKWYALKNRNTCYAVRASYANGKQQTISMHRVILGLKPGDGKITDHINRNGLDNRELNLRIVTNQQNHFNQKNTKGYSWNKKDKKWEAYIGINGKNIYLGSFDDEKDACKAYLEAKMKYHNVK